MKDNIKLKCILTSYIVGLPIGLFIIGLFIILPSIISNEGLIFILLKGVYGSAVIGLIIAFIISLYIGGFVIFKSLENKKSILVSSFRYSLVINIFIWCTFFLITIFQNFKSFNFLIIIPPIILFLICLIISPFTIGFLVTKYLQKKYFNENGIQ